ncbi:MAG: amino acid adenylation domain-containing protein, partial [Bacteroidota bacterium]
AYRADDRSLLMLNYTFDVSVGEIFNALTHGATLHLIDEETAIDVPRLAQFIKERQITVSKFAVAMFNALVDYDVELFASYRFLTFGGEAASSQHIKKAFAVTGPGVLINAYGPTETTIISSYELINSNDFTTISIGRPVNNARFYIVDQNGQLTGRGVVGEIWIGGDAVAQGYLNRPKLNTEKFIADPFAPTSEARLYRTGDLGRWLSNGTLEFIGRKDGQVKIRGYRIELGEIENALLESGLVQQAVVRTKDDNSGNKQLVAYVIPKENFDKLAILVVLQEKLPSYMVPAAFVAMESFPRTANDKIDHHALPEPELLDRSTVPFVAPRSALEEKIAKIWAALLAIERVGIHDHFFDLGGHSLLATRLIARLNEVIDVPIKIRDLFQHPSLAQFANFVDSQETRLTIPDLTPQERPAWIPLSFAQERLWLVHQMTGSLAYHNANIFKIRGPLHVQHFCRAFELLVQRHEVLRSLIKKEHGKAYQVSTDGKDWKVEFFERPPYQNQEERHQYLEQLSYQDFDFSEEYPIRVQIIQEEENEYLLSVILHHIASDAWSGAILLDELLHIYHALKTGAEPSLPPLSVQYADYAIWQRKHFGETAIQEQLDYWKQQLTGVSPLELPTDFPRPKIQSTRGNNQFLLLNPTLSQQLHQLAKQQQVTPFMLLMAACKLLMHRYSGQEDICIGTSVAGRTARATEALIGCFVNTLAIRSQVNQQQSFVDFLQQVKQSTLDAYANQTVPFEQVVSAIGIERDLSHSPIFQVSLTYQNTPPAQQRFSEDIHLDESPTESLSIKTQRDLSFFASETEEGLQLAINYCTDLFNDQTAKGMLGHLQQLLQAIVEQAGQAIGQLEMIGQDEQTQLIEQFNQTKADYPKTQSIAQLFEAQVALHPEKTALAFNDQSWTYQELNQQANLLAHFLVEQHQIQSGDFVGILMDRSEWMIISILGILKAGAAYVPIDPKYPGDRKAFMIQDTAIKTLLILSEHLFEAATLDVSTFALDIQLDELEQFDRQTSPKVTSHIQDNAYIMYTSGTTGQPKGILIRQQSVIQLAHEQRHLAVNKDDKVLQWSNFAFDGSIYEIFATLLNGASLQLISRREASDPQQLAQIIEEKELTIAFITTALFNTFVDFDVHALKRLQKLLFGGEMVSVHHVKKALEVLGPDKLIHVYGPTEATVFATYYSVQECRGSTVPIGHPLSNTQIYIVNENAQLAGINVLGEIWIAGDGLADGYLNRPDLNSQKFVDNPFGEGLAYRTGDLARILPSGQIEFIGRRDNQVKIRGYRIELGEIETALRRSKFIQQAVVTAQQDPSGSKQLVAYVLKKDGFDVNEVKIELKESLPEYMAPTAIIELDQLPLTPNGKIDLKALPTPELSDLSSKTFVAPRSESEKVLAQIWQSILKLNRVGIHDNFFDLGGHSLLATRVISDIYKQLQIEISMRDLFQHNSLESLADFVDQQESNTDLPKLTPQERPEFIPLSFAQERLWFIDQLAGSIHYHMPMQFTFTGDLDVKAIEKTFQTIINRHEVLRTVFRTNDEDQAYQHVLPASQWRLDISPDFDDEKAQEQYVRDFINHPFDLENDHMLRVLLTPIGEQENELTMVFHHIASDGWSHHIFFEELTHIYSALVDGQTHGLEPLAIQYADFAIWQKRHLSGQLLEQKMAYWEGKLKGVQPLNLPTDYNRPKLQSMEGNSVRFKFDQATSTKLDDLARQEKVTLFMLLLSAFKVLLYRYSGQDDICVGTPIANRTQKEIEAQIGFFVNSLAFRSDLSDNPKFNDLLAQVKVTALDAFKHQDIPFEKIVERIESGRDQSRSPVFQVMFVLQNNPEAEQLEMGKFELEIKGSEYEPAKYDITFSSYQDKDGIICNFTYCRDLFSAESMEQMSRHFQCLVKAIVEKPHAHIDQLKMMDKEEQMQMIRGFSKNKVDYPKDTNVLEGFEQQVANNPNLEAAAFGEQSLTYAQLNQQAEQLAGHLQAQGVAKGDFIAICMKRSLEWLCATIAVVKTGATYVPMESNYPQERIKYLLEDSQSSWLISDADFGAIIDPQSNTKQLIYNSDWSATAPYQKIEKLEARQLVYVIYTSGSTGKPKGVMIEHKALNNFVHWHNRYHQVDTHTKATIMASIGFDASSLEIWPYLTK